MSKFMTPPGLVAGAVPAESNDRLERWSLPTDVSAAQAGRLGTRRHLCRLLRLLLLLRLLQLLAHDGRVRVVGSRLQEAPERVDIDGQVPLRLRGRGQVLQVARVVRRCLHDPLERVQLLLLGLRVCRLDRRLPVLRRLLQGRSQLVRLELLPERARRVEQQLPDGLERPGVARDLLRVLGETLLAVLVERRERLQLLDVLRPPAHVALERRDPPVPFPLLLVGVPQVLLALRLVRVLRDLLLRLADGGAAAASEDAAEVALQEVAEAGGAGADAEGDEAQRERDREDDEDPPRVAPDPLEEERLPAYAPAGTASTRLGRLPRSIRLRAAPAFRRRSRHSKVPRS